MLVVRSGLPASPSARAPHSNATGSRAPVYRCGRALAPAAPADRPGAAARFVRGRSGTQRLLDAEDVPPGDRPGETSHCPSPRRQRAGAAAPDLDADPPTNRRRTLGRSRIRRSVFRSKVMLRRRPWWSIRQVGRNRTALFYHIQHNRRYGFPSNRVRFWGGECPTRPHLYPRTRYRCHVTYDHRFSDRQRITYRNGRRPQNHRLGAPPPLLLLTPRDSEIMALTVSVAGLLVTLPSALETTTV